ncbi:hypothetical protein PYW07_008286 [Mythimna separata]|uniref:CRAL-TRIO domain-containing protein n=1 Tax=Mythimna separata TaxID=271217 RepID=A0AAD7YCE0_MYTSE|nr:hypothetical protein PYW07_008286 [Mythimna separata]
METFLKNPLFRVSLGDIYEIRKIHNLEKPGRMEQAVNILESWILKQDHIIKKDFSKVYLELALISNKGSVEKAKKQIDRLCTMKALLPKFFLKTNVKMELQDLMRIGKLVAMPTLTDDFYRIILVQISNTELRNDSLMQYYQYITILAEYVKTHDYCNGIIMIYDCRQLDLFDLMTKLNTVELQQIITILVEGYGARLKGIHMLTESKAIELLINIVKQIVSEKISKRIYSQRSLEDLYKEIPKKLLPVDYGGKQRSVDDLHDDLVKELSSPEHIEYVKMMFKACTDESKRHAAKFNEEYMGMPGSFRCLSVD